MGFTIQTDELFTRFAPANDDLPPGESIEIERVQRLAHLEHDVIRHVDHVVDRAQSHRLQSANHPIRARADFDVADDAGRVMGTQVERLDLNVGDLRSFGRGFPGGGMDVLRGAVEQGGQFAGDAEV